MWRPYHQIVIFKKRALFFMIRENVTHSISNVMTIPLGLLILFNRWHELIFTYLGLVAHLSISSPRAMGVFSNELKILAYSYINILLTMTINS